MGSLIVVVSIFVNRADSVSVAATDQEDGQDCVEAPAAQATSCKMNPPCAACNKSVYPVEKLRCLDKVWHKGCFRCNTCGMTLNMKNYKGYDKMPYCNAHIPKAQFTVVSDTPENRRLAKTQENISQLKYHEQFHKDKGQFTAVADDPESLRCKKNTQQASDVAYKGGASDTRRIQKLSDSGPPPTGEAPYSPPPMETPVAAPSGHQEPALPRWRALYDYAAADDDEVSFNEGDVILNGQIIDEGWMTGLVERTGQQGMLPSNYVEQI